MEREPQDFEAEWWGNCTNTYGEETKQLTYARMMGIPIQDVGRPGPVHQLAGASVVDIGGGPCSMLLKTVGGGDRTVVDPLPLPDWCLQRYAHAGILYTRAEAEDWQCAPQRYDEAWIYNVLQHVRDPEKVVQRALASARLVRCFEWLGVPPHEGHPHELTKDQLEEWFGFEGYAEFVNENGAVGLAWVGIGLW